MKYLLLCIGLLACNGAPFDASLFSADAQDGGGDAHAMVPLPDAAGIVTHRRSDAATSDPGTPDGEPAAPDAAPEGGSGGLAAGGSGGATGGTGGAMVGGAGGALSMGGSPDGGAPPVPDGGAPSTPDACVPVTHDNGVGQTWEDCVPLYTYNLEQAMKACKASGAAACIQNSRCGSGVGEVEAWDATLTTPGTEWGYENFATGLVALAGIGMCSAPKEHHWN